MDLSHRVIPGSDPESALCFVFIKLYRLIVMLPRFRIFCKRQNSKMKGKGDSYRVIPGSDPESALCFVFIRLYRLIVDTLINKYTCF